MTECNVPNRTIFCDDNLDVLQGINSECIDLIYLDPPFNKNKEFTAPIGTSAEGAGFKDIFRKEDMKEEWLATIKQDLPELYGFLDGIKGVGKPYNFAYAAYMSIRLIECHRILKNTGSIYLHCDPTMCHHLKLVMDAIFLEKNYRTQIAWKRATSSQKGSQHRSKKWGNNTDIILYYAKSNEAQLNPYRKLTENERILKFKNIDEHGNRYYDDSAHIWRTPNMGVRQNLCYEWKGYKNPHPAGWRLSRERLEEEYKKGNIVILPSGKLQRRKYESDYPGYTFGNFWDDINFVQGEESVGYPTQKPVALLERIVKASSNENDVVLDPFCGCATACVVAERLGRQWIGVDISVRAYELVKERLTKESVTIWQPNTQIHMFTDPPKRTDIGKDYREKKFVYVISHPAYPGEYKVGIAKNVKLRLNAYQTSDPDRQYKVEFKMETPYFRETELFIHTKFPNKHEWVQGNLKEIINEIRNFKPVEQSDGQTLLNIAE